MSWRKIKKEDIDRGVIVRMNSIINDGGYGMATIIDVSLKDAEKYPEVTLARPFAYARDKFNTKTASLGEEIFSVQVSRLVADFSDFEVFEGRDGLRKMLL